MTTVGFIGSGNIGGTVARMAVAAGYDVVLSNSRGPQTLRIWSTSWGRTRGRPPPVEAAAAGDLAVVSIPPRAYPAVPVQPLAGKQVLTRSTTSRSATGGYQGSVARCPAARCSSGTWAARTW
jgi:hypothetical protein